MNNEYHLRNGVWNALRRFSRPANRALVEELLQEAQIAVWQKQDTICRVPDDERRAAFIRNVSYYAALAWLKRDARTRRNDSLVGEMRLQGDKQLHPDIVSALVVEFFRQRQKGGKRGLDAASRDAAIVVLLYEGYTASEIADLLGISYNSVKQYRRDIRARLRELL